MKVMLGSKTGGGEGGGTRKPWEPSKDGAFKTENFNLVQFLVTRHSGYEHERRLWWNKSKN